MPSRIALLLAAAAMLAACSPPFADSPLIERGCGLCHAVEPDGNHGFGCTACHQGDANSRSLPSAHLGLVKRPGHPANMAATCGKCHPKEVEAAEDDPHFTLEDEIRAIWTAFFDSSPPTMEQLASPPWEPGTREAIVGDLMARRCLRCHPYWQGDSYDMTLHNTGCATCHSSSQSEGPDSHKFTAKVGDAMCLSCHRSSFVGWDYYGFAEVDTVADFDAPLYQGRHLPRPFGTLWHEMTPDVHMKAGFACTDCHQGGPCTPRGTLLCTACHAGEGASYPMTLDRPGHRPGDMELVDCQVCHAIWQPLDLEQELVLPNDPDYDDWFAVAEQGSSEVERTVLSMLALPYEMWGEGYMANKFSGKEEPGIWFRLLGERRFWPVRFQEVQGRMAVVRPILDICVSAGDEEKFCAREESRWLRYKPHTVGPADRFRSTAVERWLREKGR